MNAKSDYTPKSNATDWHITYKCDLNCPSCYRLCFLPPTTLDMTFDDAREFNRQARERSWFPRIAILGGVPTRHRDVFACIDSPNRSGLRSARRPPSAPNRREVSSHGLNH